MTAERNYFSNILFCILLTIILSGNSFAQDYQIKNVVVYLSPDSVEVDFTVQDFFRDKILKTLLAGMSLDLNLVLILNDDNSNIVAQRILPGKINYDVWDEYFVVVGLSRKIQQFSYLEELENWFTHFESQKLTAVDILNEDINYQVVVELNTILLDRKQSQQLKWWLQNSDQTEEEKTSQDRSSGFRLNLNHMVQLFFSGKEQPDKFTGAGFSTHFTLQDLKFK